MKLRAMLTIILASTLTLFGCNKQDENAPTTREGKDNPLIIYTTVYPLQDFTEKIGGKHVQVESVYPPGVDVHTYEPTAKTMQQIAEADAFIYIGQGMEGFVDRITKTLEHERVKFVAATENMELLSANDTHGDEHAHENEDEHAHENEDEHAHGDVDPHVWLDPIYSIEMAETIKQTLVELKPEAKDDFEQNFASLKQQLEQLDQQFQQLMKEAKRKDILVAHAAYGYWEKRYGLKQISVTGLSPTNEPSQKQLTSIIKQAKEHNIQYIFFEQNVTSKIAEVVKNEIGADVLILHNLEARTNDDIANNKDYFAIMHDNISALKKALQ
ncbi:adhesin [Anoxybacillus gonensis]|uniref:Metal ABC transporter substrate-binding protein n=1 Tax=Anoxybacillus gonensis TaxID=198467 RepID=A0AAW7THC4_9BACL|nr:metal ABC transporter substrate-binding protein [Anoxybacillus gonensis]AKS39327.1 adhesin [Anoxybacillus gonensis]KGP62058.1 adhesin [Anoxybacillus gonensis]MDO0877096.1 metal ABC transporter substrate-binding protein [Anoxybacillus gonensis]